MADRTLYLVAYDVRHPKRLAKVGRYFHSYRVAGQKSVPEIWVTPMPSWRISRSTSSNCSTPPKTACTSWPLTRASTATAWDRRKPFTPRFSVWCEQAVQIRTNRDRKEPRTMTSLYVDRRDVHLRHDAGAIAFYENGQRSATVPLAPLTRLILRGKVTLEAALLGHLGDRGVGVLFLSGRNGEPHLLLGPGHNDVRRRVAQTRCSLDSRFCLQYARYLVDAKLGRQITSLDELRQHYPAQRQPLTQALRQLQEQRDRLSKATSLESLRGMEGAAAVAYFSGLRAVVPPSLQFHERNRRPPRDPFNALLSLTYTIATAEIAMALHIAGYDPCIGYYHQISPELPEPATTLEAPSADDASAWSEEDL